MTARADVTAIVLAGGRSSRFGSPKLDANLEGRTILDHAIDVVRQLTDDVVVSVAHGESTSAPAAAVRVVADAEPFEGPLAGLASALEEVSTPFAIVIGGDMPRLSPTVLALLLDDLDPAHPDRRADAVVLGEGETSRPLPLALRAEPARAAATALLADGERSLRALVARLDARVLAEAEWRRLDPSGGSLVDIDRPEDLRGLAERASDRHAREVR